MTIEEFVIDYLSDALAAPVSGDVPSPMPEEFVTVEKTGGNITDHIQYATIAVQSWSGTRAEAMTLCQLVENAMAPIVTEKEISECSLSNSYNFTDTSRNKPRYQSLFELVYSL